MWPSHRHHRKHVAVATLSAPASAREKRRPEQSTGADPDAQQQPASAREQGPVPLLFHDDDSGSARSGNVSRRSNAGEEDNESGSNLVGPQQISQMSGLPERRLSPVLQEFHQDAEALRSERKVAQKKNEAKLKHKRLLAQREADSRFIKERCQQLRDAREQHLFDLLQGLRNDDAERMYANSIIEKVANWEQERRETIYAAWQKEVGNQVAQQVVSQVAAEKPPGTGAKKIQEASASKTVVRHGGDPVKRRLHEHLEEERFRRVADALISASQPAKEGETPRGSRQPCSPRTTVFNTPRRPLPVEQWEQLKIGSSPIGYLACNIEHGPGEAVLTGKRIGAGVHMPDEADGIPVAGKSKQLGNRGGFGILVGTFARDGQASLHTNTLGASGALGQDHYNVERGRHIVACEFPKGKRTYY